MTSNHDCTMKIIVRHDQVSLCAVQLSYLTSWLLGVVCIFVKIIQIGVRATPKSYCNLIDRNVICSHKIISNCYLMRVILLIVRVITSLSSMNKSRVSVSKNLIENGGMVDGIDFFCTWYAGVVIIIIINTSFLTNCLAYLVTTECLCPGGTVPSNLK